MLRSPELQVRRGVGSLGPRWDGVEGYLWPFIRSPQPPPLSGGPHAHSPGVINEPVLSPPVAWQVCQDPRGGRGPQEGSVIHFPPSHAKHLKPHKSSQPFPLPSLTCQPHPCWVGGRMTHTPCAPLSTGAEAGTTSQCTPRPSGQPPGVPQAAPGQALLCGRMVDPGSPGRQLLCGSG